VNVLRTLVECFAAMAGVFVQRYLAVDSALGAALPRRRIDEGACRRGVSEGPSPHGLPSDGSIAVRVKLRAGIGSMC
jgi:hypothetical protein